MYISYISTKEDKEDAINYPNNILIDIQDIKIKQDLDCDVDNIDFIGTDDFSFIENIKVILPPYKRRFY